MDKDRLLQELEENEELTRQCLDAINEGKKYPVKLTWANIITVGSLIVTIVGGSFGFGYKVNDEINKTKIAKLERHWESEKLQFKKDYKLLEEELHTTNRDLKYFKWQLNVVSKKYKNVKEFFELLKGFE